MIVDAFGPCDADADDLSLRDYLSHRLAELRVAPTGAMWGVFVDHGDGLPSGLVMPLD